MTPPSLATLTARFLAAKVAAPESDTQADVMPHEVVTGFRADATATWADAKVAFDLFGVSGIAVTIPPDWGTFLSQLPDATVMPLCLGAVPQRMRDLTVVKPSPTIAATTLATTHVLTKWIDAKTKSGTVAEQMVVAALRRVRGEYEAADAIHSSIAPSCSGSLSKVLANERAALLWARGKETDATTAWAQLGDSPVANFNRGVCAWRAGQLGEAAKLFDKAVGAIPDRSGWSHLAAFYASLCEGET